MPLYIVYAEDDDAFRDFNFEAVVRSTEAAALLGVHERIIRTFVNENKLTPLLEKLGCSPVYFTSEVRALKAARLAERAREQGLRMRGRQAAHARLRDLKPIQSPGVRAVHQSLDKSVGSTAKHLHRKGIACPACLEETERNREKRTKKGKR